MALSQHDLLRLMESLRTAEGIELIRVLAQQVLQELIEAEATAHIGAEPGEHTEARTTWRNGHREKLLTTQAGDLDLAIPKVRTGTFFPSLLERRRRIDQALYAVIMEAYVQGVSTPSVDDLVKALGVMVGDNETEAFWAEFLRSLRARGLDGVRLVLADHHAGRVAAIRKVLLGAAYQRCRVDFLRNVLGVIPKVSGEMVAATIRTIFAQPTAELVGQQLDTVADMLARQFPKVSEMLLEAKEDLTAFAVFPVQHWKKIHSTNPLERINREIKRRTDVVQVFPNPDALLRLTTAVLSEMHDEWIAFGRRYLSMDSMDKIYADHDTRDELPAATPSQGT